MRSSLLAWPMEGGHEVVNPLPVDPYVYGAITLVALIFLLLVTFAFRNVWNRHR